MELQVSEEVRHAETFRRVEMLLAALYEALGEEHPEELAVDGF